MAICTAADRSGLPARTIRYYEEIGLTKPRRTLNGYRDHSDGDLHKLAFLYRARGFGCSVEGCRQLLALYGDTSSDGSAVQ